METLEILTRNAAETKKLGQLLAKEIIKHAISHKPYGIRRKALVVSLEGELGSGKTTFTQGFAKGLGVRENPRSPTFVILQLYAISHKPYGIRHKAYGLRQFVHIDAYRLKSKDFKILNWGDFVKNKENIILVEWGNKIRDILPKNSLRIKFRHIGHEKKRLIKFINP